MHGVTDDLSHDFEPHRRFLVGLAYRMLGSVAEAEDAVQDAYLRWRGVDRAAVADPRAYLARVVSRQCLDRMKSAVARREQYVGTWLPEPMVDDPAAPLADDLSLALLLTLERLSPLERAAFLLHDVFDMDYAAIAEVLERSEPACRQLAARAREHVREERPRFQATEDASTRLTTAFHTATTTGDVAMLAEILAEDAVFYSDGGGKKLAALNPIYGRDKIIRFVIGVAGKRGLPTAAQIEPARINGLPGFVLRTEEGPETIALEISGERIVAIYVVRNPDKLRHLT
jgi:RNA polymerase sigma-70 factor, ECF subfamily